MTLLGKQIISKGDFLFSDLYFDDKGFRTLSKTLWESIKKEVTDKILNRLYYLISTWKSIHHKNIGKELSQLIYEMTGNKNYKID
jgi:hypothetical protein